MLFDQIEEARPARAERTHQDQDRVVLPNADSRTQQKHHCQVEVEEPYEIDVPEMAHDRSAAPAKVPLAHCTWDGGGKSRRAGSVSDGNIRR